MSDIRFFHPRNEHNLPISKSAIAGDFMYTWGDGQVIRAGSEEQDMRLVFERIKSLLAEQGLTMADVVKVTALLTNMKQWPIYTKVYKSYFAEPYPCRTTIPVQTEDDILELDVVAYKKGLSK